MVKLVIQKLLDLDEERAAFFIFMVTFQIGSSILLKSRLLQYLVKGGFHSTLRFSFSLITMNKVSVGWDMLRGVTI